MDASTITPYNDNSQEHYQIAAEVQFLNRSDTAISAHADVTIVLPRSGWIKICGFSILESPDKPLRILPPARKGTQRYFDVVVRRIRQDVDAAIKAEYRRSKGYTMNQPHGPVGCGLKQDRVGATLAMNLSYVGIVLGAEKLVDDELSTGDPRSMEYRQGVLDAIRFRLGGIPIPRRYQVGTAQADAYFAGIERGHALWRMRQKRPEAGREERL